MAIETERGPSGKPVTRSRINGTTTACHYPKSNRIIVVADKGDWASAYAALMELSEAVDPDGQAAIAATVARLEANR